MKKFRFTMGTLILAMMATTFMACNKEKESSVVQQTTGTEDVVRKPIATTDLKTGVTTFTYSIEEYQSFLDRITQNRKEGSDLVFEYIEIMDNNAKTSIPELTLECSVIDVKRECSHVMWLNNEFFDIVNNGNTIKYFIKEEIEDGNFSFLSYCKSGAYLITVTNHEYQAELFDTGTKSNRPPKKRQVSCEKEDCQLGTCQPADFGDYGWGCNPCVSAGPNPKCKTIISPDDTWLEILKAALGLFPLLFR